MRGAQRRGAVEQRRDRLPGDALVGELVGFRRHAEAVAGFQRDAERLAGQRVVRLAAIGIDVDARERLADEVVGDDVAGGVESRRAPCGSRPGPSGPSRCPGRAYIARAPACRPPWPAPRRPSPRRRHRCGRRSPGPVCPDHVDGVLRHVEHGGEARAHEMRFLRAAPAGDLAVLDLDQRAGRPHAGMRLERPLVFGLDHARRQS